jgi:hypothetical protein
MGKFGQNENIESCLEYDEENGCLVYTTNLGNDKSVKLPSDKVTGELTGECELVVMVNGVECDRIDVTPVLDKYNFNYDSNTHTITVGPDGAEVPFVLNCATLELNTASGVCELVYTNEKGGENKIPLPLLSMARDEDACTVTADDGKGGTFSFYEGANPETDIALELDDNKDLCLRYKTKECHIVLPNFVTDFALDQTNCILKVFKWCDVEPTEINLFAAIGLTKNDDGGFDLQIKDQLCTFSPASLIQNPDNPNEFTFDNQYGQTVTITLPTSSISDNENGTATIVMADGTTKTNVVCGQAGTVTDNGDGTGTVTMNDGTTCTFLKTVELPADIRITGLSFEESDDGSMHSLVATLSDGSTINAGPIVDQFSSVAPNAAGEGGGVGTATITTPQGVKNDVVCGVQSTVVANEDAPGTATITQNDGSQKTDVLCGTPSSVVPNDAEIGGGVGTATMTQTDGSVKNDVVCGAQSTVVPSEDGRTATFTQNDGSTKEVLCAGNDSITQNEEGVGGGVGTSTITLPGGDVKADVVCGQQSTVVDNENNTGTVTQNDGRQCDFIKAVNDTCGEEIDPADAKFHTTERGSLVLALGRGANGNNANVFNPECLPPEPACPDQYQWTSRDGIIWQWDVGQQRWRAISTTSCFRVHEDDAPVEGFPEGSAHAENVINAAPANGGIDDAALQAAFDAYGQGVAIPLAIHETCIPAGECMQRIIYGGHYRANPTSELSSQINLNVFTETSTDGGGTWGATSLWGGSPGKTIGQRSCILEALKTINPDCDFAIINDDYNLDQHSPGLRLINPGDGDYCVRTILTFQFAEDYVSRPGNRLTPGAQQLTFFSQRNSEAICTAQVLDGFQFG